MIELKKRLEKHKPKHNLKYDIEHRDYDSGNQSVCFVIFNKDFKCRIIYIYSFDDEKEIKQKAEQIKKLLNNKRKALLFIGTKPEGS